MIDTGLGNLQSVLKTFERIGAPVRVTANSEDVAGAEAVILPGVGAFGDGMANLHKLGLAEPLREYALVKKRPLLGICLGMQLMADEGEEHGFHKGLGFVRGRVRRLEASDGMRVPNMGWCDVKVTRRCILFPRPDLKQALYFAHSFYLDCPDEQWIVATIDHGRQITAAIEHHNLFGVQFHPEKSQDAGLDVISAFVEHIRAAQN